MSDIRDRILNAAAAIYAQAGYRGTTTRLIASEAGVNEVTLFRHFGTKEALVKEALQRFGRTPGQQLGEPEHPREELRAWALDTYQHWYRGRKLIARVVGDLPEHPELAPDICEQPGSEHAMLCRYLARMRERGMTRPDVDPDVAAGLLLGGIFAHTVWRDYLHRPDLPAAEVVIAEFVDLLLSAIGAGAPSEGAAP